MQNPRSLRLQANVDAYMRRLAQQPGGVQEPPTPCKIAAAGAPDQRAEAALISSQALM